MPDNNPANNSDNSLQWQLGDMKITLVREILSETDPAQMFHASYDAGDVAKHESWLKPHFLNDNGLFHLSIHAFVLESEGQTIMVDTCLGNRTIPGFDRISNIGDGFLTALSDAGYEPADINTVVCTHLHFDHVGWNTMLKDGEWVPTFPNARYLFGKQEYEFWAGTEEKGFAFTFGDAVQPVVDAGLADLVENDTQVTGEVWLEPTPGHTPGHASVHLSSGGDEGVITGDMAHHPIQFAEPQWGMDADENPQMATQTRRDFAKKYGDTDVTIFGTHFGGPTCGHICSAGEGWEFRAAV